MRKEREGGFHGINMGHNMSSISHLMFVDDTILFFRANGGEVDVVMFIKDGRDDNLTCKNSG